MPDASALEQFLQEAQTRLGNGVEITATSDARSYIVTARRNDSKATSKMRRDFYDQYLRSGNTDCCDCVEHFFEHLAARLRD